MNGLLDDFWHNDLVLALLGGHLGENLRIIGLAGLIAFAPDIEDLVGVGHRFDAFDVDRIELFKVAENVVELAAEPGLLVIRKLHSRQIRDVINVYMWCFCHSPLIKTLALFMATLESGET